MTTGSRVVYGVMHAALRIPLVSRLALGLYVLAITSRTTSKPFLATYREVSRSLRDRKTIFLMYEPRFGHIMRELAGQGTATLILGRGFFDYLFQKYLRAYIETNTRNYGEYALDAYERYRSERGAYLAACTMVARLLRRHFAPSTIVLPKYNDDYTLELIQAFHDAGWRTIVYDREGTVTRRRLELIPAIVARQAPACDVVVTYNETHKAFFNEVFRLSATPRPEIIVLGNPAADDWFLSNTLRTLAAAPRPAGRRKIVFFAFGEFSYVYDAEYLRGKEEVWRTLLTEIHQILIEHLADHPQDELLYKRGAKGNRDYWPGSERLLASPNATLVSSAANANELIADADVVVAFQTTALIDAMHTGTRIIYCAWGDRYQELKDGLIDCEAYARAGAIMHARSAEEFKQLLARSDREVPVNVQARKAIRETFTTNPDGMVSTRFATWVAGQPVGHPARPHVSGSTATR